MRVRVKTAVPFRHSLSWMVDRLFILGAALCVLGIVMVATPQIRKEYTRTVQNNMLDTAEAKGEMVDRAVDAAGNADEILNSQLRGMMKGVKIKDVKSSYAYVIKTDGTMLYHPTESKIGQPVENSAMKEVVSKIQNKETVSDATVEYTYDGQKKYASYYVGKNAPFILVMSADAWDIMHPIFLVFVNCVIFGILIAVALGTSAFFIIQKKLRPVQTMVQSIDRMKDLDMTEDSELTALTAHTDEFGLMGKSLSALAESLSDTVRKIKDATTRLGGKADEIRESAQTMDQTAKQVDTAVSEIANGATNQAENTQSASEAVIALGTEIENVRNSADEMHEASKQMTEDGNVAKAVLMELRSSNADTQNAVKEIGKQIEKTNESATNIQKAAALISGIAGQTNLLSLNASIEAAHAGEQGRGFAVVAENIGNLAEQSRNAAKEIEDMIGELMKDSESTVELMNSVTSVTEEQSKKIEQTAESFQSMGVNIEKTAEGAGEIQKKTVTMDKKKAGITDTVESLSAIAEENAAGTEESSASVTQLTENISGVNDASKELSEIAKELNEVVDQFTV